MAAQLQAGDIRYDAAEAAIDGSGEFVLVNPRLDQTYSTGGGAYAQP